MINHNYKDLACNIICIDTGHIRDNFTASYLVCSGNFNSSDTSLVSKNPVAFIDTGTHLSVPRLLSVLKVKKITPAQVVYVIATHIHLDHSGGAGELLTHLPYAKLVVHERGAPHLINPKKLKSSVISVYGQSFFKKNLGDIIPIDARRILVAKDGDVIMLGNRALKLIDTPGHAKHHICIWDERSKGIFSGDTLGVSYREFDSKNGVIIFPPTSPNQFEPERWKKSIDKLMHYKPKYAYLTHFNAIKMSKEIAEKLKSEIDFFASTAKKHAHQKKPDAYITKDLFAHLFEIAKQNGCTLSKKMQWQLLKGDLDVFTKGLVCWLEKAPSIKFCKLK